MADAARKSPTHAGTEREILEGYLDFHRATILQKIAGVSDEDLRRKFVPSANTLLGLLKHLAYVERGWFQAQFAGRDIEYPEAGIKATWIVEPQETVEEIVALYQNEVRISREITANANLDDLSVYEDGDPKYTLRWILTHMIQETARHNGHADILRELIDGSTGM
jgi:uncharacterized damage-inducible protein DinB